MAIPSEREVVPPSLYTSVSTVCASASSNTCGQVPAVATGADQKQVKSSTIQKQSEAIRSKHDSGATKGHRGQSRAIKGHHLRPERAHLSPLDDAELAPREHELELRRPEEHDA